jgi:hypothetical protein
MPGAPHCFVRAISKKSAEQFAEQLAEGSRHKANKFVLLSASAIFGLRPFILLRLGKANKFVLLSASAYICPTFRSCLNLFIISCKSVG